MSSLNGQCLCGAIKVNVKSKDVLQKAAACRCNNCRTTASSTMSLVALVPKSDFEINGEVSEYQDNATKSGNTITRQFCSKCGTPIASASPNYPDAVFLKAGLFIKDNQIGKPGMELFGNNKQSWEQSIDGAQQL